MKGALALFIFLAAFASDLSAHEVRPAYLELRQTGPETYDALWKVQFLKELHALTPGRWLGPIRSGYGLHLVFLVEKTEGGTAGLGSNRELVRREWKHAQRVAASERFYQELLQRYTVTIEETKLAQAASQGTKRQ